MRFVLSMFIAAIALLRVSSAQQAPPPWPQIPFDSCPALAQPMDPNQLTWKHGEPEKNALQAIGRVTDDREAASLLMDFVSKYPDSDAREFALGLAMSHYIGTKDVEAQLRVAVELVRPAAVTAGSQVLGYVVLASTLSPYVFPDDPLKDHKLADLASWERCGRIALSAQVKAPSQSQEDFDKGRQTSESILDRTSGFVAYMRQDYVLADAKLEAASKLNSQDPLTCLWLAVTKFFLPVPDSNSGIFYLARLANLAPKTYGAKPEAREAATAYLKQIYRIVHGSEKGLPDVIKLAESNTVPPPGFNVLPKPKEKHHYGSAIAAAAIVGLLIYGAAAHPDVMEALSQSLAQPQETKLMIFGGQDHRTYLGCLSCPETASDSVFNELGQYGSPYRPESIWNALSPYGSALSSYSACNPLANDPPVIVDQEGTAYGRLTLNRTSPRIGAGARFYDWLASAVCRR
jgi:hypothetical protein